MSDTRKQPTDAEMLTMARECRVEYGFNVPETLLFARRLWKAGRKAGLEEAAWVCDTVDGSDYDNCSRLLKALSDVIRTRAILRGLAKKPE